MDIDDLMKLQDETWRKFEVQISIACLPDLLDKFYEAKNSASENLQSISSLFCLSESARYSAEKRSAKYVMQLSSLQKKCSIVSPTGLASSAASSSIWLGKLELERRLRIMSKYLRLWERGAYRRQQEAQELTAANNWAQKIQLLLFESGRSHRILHILYSGK